MGIICHSKKGTGRAKCKLCGKVIAEGQIAIIFMGNKESCQIHSKPEECGITLR